MEMGVVFFFAWLVLLVFYAMLAVGLYFALYRKLLRKIRSTALRVLFIVLVRPLATAVAIFVLALASMYVAFDLDDKELSFCAFMVGSLTVYTVVFDIVVGLVAAVVSIVRGRRRNPAEG